MKQALVIDTSREIPFESYKNENIFPVGYRIEDSKGQIYSEREHIHSIHTNDLISVLNEDKKAQIYAPSIKDFVELYTFLAEEYNSLVSIHSSYFTPAVFEHALIAKKMVSGITIDLIDTPTISSAAGIFTCEMAKFIPQAKNINDIRKRAIDLNKNIVSYTITQNENLMEEEKGNISKNKILPFVFKNYILYHYFHSQWNIVMNNRILKNVFREMTNRINLSLKTKEISYVFYSFSSIFKKESKDVLRKFRKISKTETLQSLISRYLLGKDFISIAFI